jgi:hypothetical protein
MMNMPVAEGFCIAQVPIPAPFLLLPLFFYIYPVMVEPVGSVDKPGAMAGANGLSKCCGRWWLTPSGDEFTVKRCLSPSSIARHCPSGFPGQGCKILKKVEEIPRVGLYR